MCVLSSAVCFKNAKQYEQAKDAYLKEAEYHTENKAYPVCPQVFDVITAVCAVLSFP